MSLLPFSAKSYHFLKNVVFGFNHPGTPLLGKLFPVSPISYFMLRLHQNPQFRIHIIIYILEAFSFLFGTELFGDI